MKKSLLFAAAVACACAANAEVFDYGFGFDNNTTMPFLSQLNNEESVFYFPEGNVDFVDKYGVAMPTWWAVPVLNTPEEAAETEEKPKGLPDLGVCISMLDGGIYKLRPDAYIGSNPEDTGYEIEEMPEENYNYPFLSWGEKGMTRTVLMRGWGSEEGFEDKDYNGATAEDWVATRNAVSFLRLGTQNIVSRTDTYFQFPAVTGDVTVTVWAGSVSDKQSADQNINVKVTPVVDGVAMVDEAIELVKETGSFTERRMYKMDPIKYDATGKNVAFQIGCNGNILHLYHVTIEGEAGVNAVEGVAVEAADAKAYNLFGVQVDENYKGLVIKNGKKFVQK